ncbi:HD domain-containing phosphohydrolase [Solirubrobacter soli]|uniref:HD domain-containing phosphohydrolase n=1 Tax=Solirubrobacter soli TaxID=363832 RepID=UPI00041A4206|nr:HD domain-containing phosphohydrolase [Solirubrobacter soli]
MEIGSHLQRMGCYSALIAERLGCDADLIRIAARLHDVGMAAVSGAVTSKPGALTPNERRELEAHPGLGHAMLTGSGVELLETAAEIALSHHERFDGAGYPRGLAGEEIPLAGRIVAVADAFDALTTDRVYRSAGSVEQAVETLRAERGRHFDPRVVDAFVDALSEAVEIHARYAPAPEEQPAMMPEDRQITLQAAAATLAISPSRLRRWADEGRIPSVRTAGGHRRFSLAAVRRLAAESGVRPTVRPVEPPGEPLPLLAENLRAHGRQLAAAAAAAIYREGPVGWFASDAAVGHLLDWSIDLGESCESGVYASALQSTTSLMTRAQGHAATLLERHAFLERFGQVCVRTLVRTGAEREEIAGTRRLFASLQQALLEARD